MTETTSSISTSFIQTFIILGITFFVILLLVLIWRGINTETKKPIVKPREQKPDDSTKPKPGEGEEEESFEDWWKTLPLKLKGRIRTVVILAIVMLVLYLGAPSRNPVYKQVTEKETVLNEGKEEVFRIKKGDSVHLSIKNLPHIIVWQGKSEYIGEEKHFETGEFMEIKESSRYVKIKPCKKHGIYGGTLQYKIYRR